MKELRLADAGLAGHGKADRAAAPGKLQDVVYELPALLLAAHERAAVLFALRRGDALLLREHVQHALVALLPDVLHESGDLFARRLEQLFGKQLFQPVVQRDCRGILAPCAVNFN